MTKSTKSTRRAYADTPVAVSKTREAIDKILIKWGVVGIQWEDNYDLGIAQLRFRWKRDDESELVARFRIEVGTEEDLRQRAIDQRSGTFSQKKYDREKLHHGKREHRVLLNLLKNMFEAIEEGIIPAEALLLPWIEDVDGQTVYDKLSPKLGELASTPLHKALGPAEG